MKNKITTVFDLKRKRLPPETVMAIGISGYYNAAEWKPYIHPARDAIRLLRHEGYRIVDDDQSS